MQRPLRAAETNGPAPLMAATGAEAASFEGVPRRAAAAEKVFGIFAWTTEPTARRLGLPFTFWTTNTTTFLLVVLLYLLQFNPLPFVALLKKPESNQHKRQSSRWTHFHLRVMRARPAQILPTVFAVQIHLSKIILAPKHQARKGPTLPSFFSSSNLASLRLCARYSGSFFVINGATYFSPANVRSNVP